MTALALSGSASATAAGQPRSVELKPASASVQSRHNLADGKFDPEHLRAVEAKEAEEHRLGIDKLDLKRTPYGTFALAEVTTYSGETSYVPVTTEGKKVKSSHPCTRGYTCLFYNSNLQGATFRQGLDAKPENIPNYAGYSFYDGNGAGQSVKNNAASVNNQSGGHFVVYYNSNYKGGTDPIPAGAAMGLSVTDNNNASGRRV
ncbi:peptidase inhibitor family I36 protein [Streptomyces roseifaciens]